MKVGTPKRKKASHKQLLKAVSDATSTIFEDQEKYEQIFINNPAIQFLINPKTGGIIDANKAACLFYGYDHHSFCSLTVFKINMLPRDEVIRKMNNVIRDNGSTFVFTHRLANGDVRKVEVFTTPITVNQREVLYSTVHDITEKHLVEERLRYGEMVFHHFIKNTPASVAMFDKDMNYVVTSKRWMSAFKIPEEDLTGKYAGSVKPDLPNSWPKLHFETVIKGTVFSMDEEQYTNIEGDEHWLKWEMHPWYHDSDHIGGSIVFVEFLTEKKKADASVEALIEQQARLASKIETIEEERRKISRELHDGIGQLLTAAHLNLELLENAIEEQSDDTIKVLHKIRKLLDTTIQETRNISHDLRPAVLDDFGLIPGLRLLAEEFSEATSINVIFQHFNFDDRIDPRLEITIYRICQEALNNIARHSGASEAIIEAFKKDDNILISVVDNGVGIPDNYRNSKNFRAGTGLNNIKERLELHGGKLQITTMKKSGTELMIEIPLS